MKKRNLLVQAASAILVFVFMAFTGQLSAQDLHYGDIIHLQNGWNNYGGGYLDTRGYQKDFEKTGNFLCVSTATSKDRAGGSGSWKVMSASGKADGTPVLVGDDVHLFNMWNKNGGYLDTRGYQKDFEKTGNFLCVSTATSKNRAGGSGIWKIMSASGKANGSVVTANSGIHLKNAWNNYGGGFLDTRGYQKDFEKTGNFLCVSTATSKNRAGGSGIWKVIISKSSVKTKSVLKAGETLTVGKKLVSANNAYMAIMQTDGNFCVYKYVNGKQGAFVWCSMAHGFSNGKIIMQTDGNLVVYDASNKAKWSSQTHPAFDSKFRNSANKPVKLVLENDGKLVLYTASGAKMWTNK